MRGVTHVLSGASAWLAVSSTGLVPGHQAAPAEAALTVVAAGSAALCDLDQCGSTAARTFGPLTEALACAVRWCSGGHREGTHSVIGAVAFTAVTAAGALTAAFSAPHPGEPGWLHLAQVAGLSVLCLVTGLAAAAALQALGLARRVTSDLAAVAAAGALGVWHARIPGFVIAVPFAVATGTAAHIAGDMLTRHGCPLAWPVSQRCFHLLPRRLRFTIGTRPEAAVAVALLAAVAWQVLSFPAR